MSRVITLPRRREDIGVRGRNLLIRMYQFIFAFTLAGTICSVGFSQQVRYELTVAPVFGHIYPPGCWVPLHIEARNHTSVPVDGSISLPVVLPNASTDFKFPLFVASNSEVNLTGYAYLPEKVLGKLNLGSGLVPVAMAEWHNADGATLARSEVLGRPDTADQTKSGDATATPGFLALLVTPADSANPENSRAMQAICRAVTARGSYAVNSESISAQWLPRHRAGYDAVCALIFDATSPDSLDLSQRKTILEYVRGGGTLIFASPLGSADPTGTWVEPFFPVHVIGSRQANQIPSNEISSINTSGNAPLKFIKPLNSVEAIDGDGDVLLSDRNYVHIAVRHYGMGRIVFTSFPVNALDSSDARVAQLWQTILFPPDPPAGSRQNGVTERRDNVLDSMIGAPVSPWSYAAFAAGGYVLVTLLLQLLFREARRPRAFAVGTIVALIMFGMLIALRMVQRGGGNRLAEARLALLEVGPKGGGVHDEVMAFMGHGGEGLTLKCDPSAWLRPLVTNLTDPATIEMLPFSAPQADVRIARIDRVWEVNEALPDKCALLGGAQFTPDGVRIEVENRTDATLLAPLVLWNRNCYRLHSLPPGRSSAILGGKNPAGDFTNGSVITSEETSLRARILELAANSQAGIDEKPRVAGWIDPTTPGLADPVLHPSSNVQQMNAQILLMAPIAVLPAEPSAKFRISPDFVSLTIAHTGQNEPYNPATREWLGSILTGTWAIGFQIPAEIGKVRLISAAITGDIAAPNYTIELRRGQCVGGTRQDNPGGPVAARWDQLAGLDTETFALDDNDVDSNGCLWLRLAVKETKGSDSSMVSPWKINNLSLGFEAVGRDH